MPLGYPPLTCRWPKPMITGRGRSFLSRLPVSPGCHDFRCRGRPATARLAAWSPLLPCFHGRPLVVVHLGMPAVSRSRSVPVARENLFVTGGGRLSWGIIGLSKSFEPTAGLWGVPPGSRTHCGAGALPLVKMILI